ncbi:MAG: hypothetical protein U0893_27750 [Chloroflexota bacterium]
MAREAISIDVASTPDVADLADEVARTGIPHVLTRDGEALAIIRPVPKRKRRRSASPTTEPTSLHEWFGDLIGIGKSDGPGDVSANIHRYVAEAILDESRTSSSQ